MQIAHDIGSIVVESDSLKAVAAITKLEERVYELILFWAPYLIEDILSLSTTFRHFSAHSEPSLVWDSR